VGEGGQGRIDLPLPCSSAKHSGGIEFLNIPEPRGDHHSILKTVTAPPQTPGLDPNQDEFLSNF